MRNKQRLMTPGPTPLPETVRLTMAQDMIHHRKDQFAAIMESVQKKLAVLFGTSQPVLPLTSTGTGAMCAAISCLFSRNEKVLVVEGGKFGERWTEIARHNGLETEIIKVEWGKAVDPDEIRKALQNNPGIAGVLIQQSETSTGVLMPIREIAQITQNSDALLIVDGISGVGVSPAPMDAWGIDCLLTGSQKGLMLPPGLALVALSARAWEKAQKTTSSSYYFDLIKERKYLEKGQTRFTSPVSLIVGLEASLSIMLANGLDPVYQKQWAMTQLLREGCKKMGLQLFAREHYAWGVTSVMMPDGIDGQLALKNCQKNFGVIMAGGQDKLKGKIIRIGHMGWVDWADCVAALTAIFTTLQEMGISLNADFVPEAITAYQNAKI